MSADFNWWLLLVGMAVGGALAWLVLADSARRDRDIEDVETAAEAAWIVRALGLPGDEGTVERVLRAHRRYLGFPPPDTLVDPDELRAAGTSDAAGAVDAAGASDAAGVPDQAGRAESAGAPDETGPAGTGAPA